MPADPMRGVPADPLSPSSPAEHASAGPDGARMAPRAADAMADMFDQVSGRYDFLNRLMTLGRDAGWRRAMWRAVPESARAVLDLCTGSGVSLPGLRRPGRLVIGIDVSLRMLELAAEHHASTGWAPRLVCADGFHLPLRAQSFDAVTIAFGIRNLRPRREALAEVARLLRPGGVLSVLEGTAPRSGLLAPFHRFYLLRVLPLLGRLSPDPSAYAYLGRSIVDFGPGEEFEADLAATGFEVARPRRFMLGAASLWIARRPDAQSLGTVLGTEGVHDARLGDSARSGPPSPRSRAEAEWHVLTSVQLGLAIALILTLVLAFKDFVKLAAATTFEPWQISGMRGLLVIGLITFVVRAVVLIARLLSGPPAR